jgi:hypothetical protein
MELKTVNPVVFDDPVYCRDKGTYDYCEYLEIVSHDCHDDEAICNLFPESDDLVFNSGKWEKCQQCKGHFQKAKEKEPDFNYFIDLSITSADGFQTFGCKADSKEEALEKFKSGNDDIVSDEVEVQGLSKPCIEDIYQ